jgi:hypothetical protein
MDSFKIINMKKISIVLGISILIMGCENPIRMETVVNEDGSLDKTIVLEEADSAKMKENIFGISKENDWEVTTQDSPHLSDSATSEKIQITFKKYFLRAEDMNAELNKQSDTLFNVHSVFEKKFRWFYTYIRYSETIKPIDRLKMVKASDYFTIEDKLFIDRLPGEGMSISKADSFYLEQLNQKIFSYYANWGIFKEEYSILQEVVKRHAPQQWLDTLKDESNIKFIYDKVDEMKGEPMFAEKMADSLGIPLSSKEKEDFNRLSKDLNSRISFMSYARDGKYQNIIHMPWSVVSTNADSVAGNSLFWKPLVTKFAIQDYEMYAEARRLNLWAVAVSLVIIGLAIFSFTRK